MLYFYLCDVHKTLCRQILLKNMYMHLSYLYISYNEAGQIPGTATILDIVLHCTIECFRGSQTSTLQTQISPYGGHAPSHYGA